MKKIGIALLSVLTVSTALGGLATFNASAAVEDVPEKVESFNVALGKEVTFRDLLDVNTTLTMYNYYPNAGGIEGTGCYAMDGAEVAHRGGNHITDGVSNDYTGYKTNSTYAKIAGWAYLDMGAEYAVEKVKVHMLAAWSFKDVIVQVSNDPNFEEGVTTVFSSCESLTLGEDVVYDGGLVGVTENIDLSGYTSNAVKSKQVDGNIFMANGATGRYVRVTNNNRGNGGADSNTNISELEVYVADSGIFAPTASVVSGTYESLTTIELSTGYADAEIYYTLDGSYPTKNSTKYEGPIDASAWTDAVALRAIAVVNGKQSEAADYVYKITVPSENKAFGKAVSFRSLTDMNTVLDAYAYYPDGRGDAFAGTGVYNLSWGDMGRLTDGNASWKSFQAHSTAPGVRGWAFLDLGEEIAIDSIKVGHLSAWCFEDVIVQVSNDPTFQTGVTTIFSAVESLTDNDGNVVYNGGQVANVDLRGETGWNGFIGVDSKNGDVCTYRAGGVTARYVRVTNNTAKNGGASAETVFTEIQVYNVGGVVASPAIKDTVKSVEGVSADFNVAPGTNVLAELPATVTVKTMAGVSKEVAVDWTSADYNPNANGVYTFTGAVAVDCDDVFEVLPEALTVRVTVEKTDTTALEALVAETRAMDNTVYTAKTWAKVETALAKADEAIANVAVTPEAVASITEEINGAIAALEELATDKTELATAIATATAMDANDYMSASIEGLAGVLAAAEAVNANTDASKAEVANAISALTAEIGKAVLKGDTTALAALIAEIEAENYVEENFTPLTWATLEDELEDAREIVAKSETPKTVVDEAYEALAAAKAGLVAYGNNAELAALVAECDALAQADYTAGSYAALTAELTEAKALLEEKLMQDVIDAAKAELQEAKDALVSVVALKEAIATTIDETLYTAISVQAWKDAKTEAQLVLDNPDATAVEIAAAVEAIEAAADGLTEIPVDSGSDSEPDSSTNSSTDSDGEESSKDNGGMLGCGGVIGSELAVALLGAVAVVLKKKKD